jgi:4'-phosphopantetheinyl transferase
MALQHRTPIAENSCLEPGRVDIWAADVDCEEAEIQHYSGFLSAAETARSARFRFARDHKRYAVRHGILRVLLSAYTNCAPREVEICSGSNRKPYVVDRAHETALQFSMSHSAGLAVFAFGRSGGVGVDIERVNGFSEMREFATMNFTPAEIKELDRCAESMRHEIFLKLWVRKEAVLKASGEGLSISLNRIDVSSLNDGVGKWSVRRIEGDVLGRDFRLTDVIISPDYIVALAAVNNGYDFSVTYRRYEPSMMELGIRGLINN